MAYTSYLDRYQPSVFDDDTLVLSLDDEILLPGDEARNFLNAHPEAGGPPTPQQIRLGICSDYDARIYDAKTAISHLIEFGRLNDPEEFMAIVSAGVRSLASISEGGE